jgi:O-methyltransferase
MIAGIATLFNDDRHYYLFDSFEGLPPAKEIDGKDPMGTTAVEWQARQGLPGMKNNVKAEVEYAARAMALSATKNAHIFKGWFNETLPRYDGKPIAILRVDGDWYDSTMDVLTHLHQYVVPGGLIILDDYYYGDGTAKAVHDFLSNNNLIERIRQEQHGGYAYLIKS